MSQLGGPHLRAMTTFLVRPSDGAVFPVLAHVAPIGSTHAIHEIDDARVALARAALRVELGIEIVIEGDDVVAEDRACVPNIAKPFAYAFADGIVEARERLVIVAIGIGGEEACDEV